MSQFQFNVDHLFHGRAIGWIVDDARYGPAEIQLYFDGQYGCSVFASLARPDVLAYNGVLLCGFDISISDDLMKRHDVISLRTSSGIVMAEILNMPDACEFTNLKYSIDVANFAEISGWCVNTINPKKSVVISAYCASEILFTTICNRCRPDVIEYLNINDNSNLGFEVNLTYPVNLEKEIFITFDNHHIIKCNVFKSSVLDIGGGQSGIILPFNIEDVQSIYTDSKNLDITVLPVKFLLHQKFGSVLAFSHTRDGTSATIEVRGRRAFDLTVTYSKDDYGFALHIPDRLV